MTSAHFKVWGDKIVADYKKGLDLNAGFQKLENEKSYGGLDYAIFYEGAKINDGQKAESAWSEVLSSAKQGGRIKISARSAKALNSLGGMVFLREANRDEMNWHRKTFLEIYSNTPDPIDTDFRCEGLKAGMYIDNPFDVKLLEQKQ